MNNANIPSWIASREETDNPIFSTSILRGVTACEFTENDIQVYAIHFITTEGPIVWKYSNLDDRNETYTNVYNMLEPTAL